MKALNHVHVGLYVAGIKVKHELSNKHIPMKKWFHSPNVEQKSQNALFGPIG